MIKCWYKLIYGGSYMKKFILVSIITLILFLAACDETQPEETIIEPQSYNIDVESFESFFSVTALIEESENHEIKIDLEPLHAYSERFGNVDVKVYISYRFNHVHIGTDFEFRFDLTSISEKTKIVDKFYSDIKIEYIAITHAMGYVKITDYITVTKKNYAAPTFVAQHEDAFSIDNPETNQQIFDELDHKIDQMMSRNDVQYYSLFTKTTQNVTLNGITTPQSQETLVRLTEGYIQYSDGSSQNIVQQEDDKLIHYHMDFLYIISDKQLVTRSVIESLDDLEMDLPGNETIDQHLFVTNASQIKIYKEESTYHIIGYLKDLISMSEYQMLISQLRDAGINPVILQRVTMTFVIEISDHELSITSEMSLDLPHDVLSNIYAKVELILSYEPFEKLNIKSDAFVIEPPDEFHEIYEETNVLEEIVQVVHGRNHKYLTYLEKGQYKLVDVNQQRLRLIVYDAEMNRLNVIPLPTHIYGTEVFIPEDGYYYLNIDQNISNNEGYAFYFQNRNYETSWNDEYVIEMGLNEIVFEGPIDVVLLRFDASENKLLRLHINNTEISKIYPDYHFYSDGIHFLEVNDGPTYLRLIGSYEGTMEMSITEVDSTWYQTSDLEVMEEITDIPSKMMVTSEQFGPRYLKLVVSEDAFYQLIHHRPEGNRRLSQPNLLTDSMEIISEFPSNGMFLREGVYVLRFYSTGVTLGTISYERIVIDPTPIEIDPTPVLYESNIPPKVSTHILHFYHIEHTFDFHVSSTEGIDLYIRGTRTPYQILDENKNPVSIVFGKHFYTQVSLVHHFEPGDYYIRFFARNDYFSHEVVYLSYLTNLPDDDSKAGSSIPWITLGDHQYKRDFTEDYEMFKFEILEAGTYTVSIGETRDPLVFDASFKLIPHNESGYYFEPGIYYLFIPTDSNRDVSIKKVK
jgi:hypothetical protein